MDRFSWGRSELDSKEKFLALNSNIKLYDGPEKSAFVNGTLSLTSHRLIWVDNDDSNCVLVLPLEYILCTSKVPGFFTRSPKIELRLKTKNSDRSNGPISFSPHQLIYLSFSEKGEDEFYCSLEGALRRKSWLENDNHINNKNYQLKEGRKGIMGIEKKMEKKRQEDDHVISQAFQDLNQLIDKAKDMVRISRNISEKLKNNNDVTQDETVKFKSYLLSLGISDPITRENFDNKNEYYNQLANQISTYMQPILKDNSGIMALTDVYCRINRSRGIELLSPEDLERACKLMENLSLSTKMVEYENGVKVLQLTSFDHMTLTLQIYDIVKDKNSVSVDELASIMNISILLAKQRLLDAEQLGKVCRDQSQEGLKFYDNLFLTQ